MQKARFCLAATFFFLAIPAVIGNAAFSSASQADAAGQPPPSGEAGETDDDPRLQINTGGHTASVRALAFSPDSSRLYSAGLDKIVQVWNLKTVTRDLTGNYLRERTIRWEVARGLRGNIYAMAAAPSDGLIAFGGFGARTNTGLVLLVDPISGDLVKVLEGHEQTVCSLAFSRDGNWLASTDTDGRTILWKRGTWEPRELYGPDLETYGEETARRIQELPAIRPLAFIGSSHLVLPVCLGKDPRSDQLVWKLQQIRVTDPKDVRTHDDRQWGLVLALVVSGDGSRMASADTSNRLYFWSLGEDVRSESVRSNWGDARDNLADSEAAWPTIMSLGFSPDGQTLLAGTTAVADPPRSQLQIWDFSRRSIRERRPLKDHVYACAISPDGERMAYLGGDQNQVFTERVGVSGSLVELQGKGRRVMDVAFALEEPYYRIAFGYDTTRQRFNQRGQLQRTFDTQRRELGEEKTLDPADWIAPDLWSGGWTVERVSDGTLQLFRGGAPRGKITFDELYMPERDATCSCFIPDAEGKPYALAVAARLQSGIYVFRLVEEGPCPLLRYFRGHNDLVTSLGISRDLRYLVSGSADNTIKIWSLSEHQKGRSPEGYWGATFGVIDQTERDLVRKQFAGPRLVVRTINEAGPLYRKGVRQGDQISKILWQEDPIHRKARSAETPEAILKDLGEIPWGAQVEFRTARDGSPRPGFQLVPAWQPLVSLFVGSGGEWAFWTPEGFYDASINGYTLFGWQVNRGLGVPPDFYRADQFHAKLEQPAVMERLLEAGSLREALRQAEVQTETEPEEALSTLIVATPLVKILVPQQDLEVRGRSTLVRARIQVPTGQELTRTRVYANGVVATERSLIAERETAEGKELTYEWDVPLPAEERSLIQLVVKTDGDILATGDVVVRRIDPGVPREPRIYILSLGINKYGDPQIEPLTYSVSDATSVRDALRDKAAGLYVVDVASLLTDQQVTPEGWEASLLAIKAELKSRAVPDDLLVIFMAGHGFAAGKSKEYYYAGHDYRLGPSPDYADCISRKNLAILEDIACRKLVILDTCHSGAIQFPRSRDPKAAVRSLQEDAIFTVTATTGGQRAAEGAQWEHGVFTKALLDGLRGEADKPQAQGGIAGNGDGIVMLNEVAAYVKSIVPQLAGENQTPTSAPDEILHHSHLPLTRVRPPNSEDR